MISKESKSECFVYITLPRETISVTAGRLTLTKDRRGNSIGQFVYGKSYLSRTNAVEIDPIDLKLGTSTYQNARLEGVFSSLRDAGPDYWGRRLIERHSGKAVLREIDYLLESPDDRAGALGFGLNKTPPAPLRKFNKTLDLARLQDIAMRLVREQLAEHDHETIQAQELLLLGTSIGGARPKTVVEDDIGLWIAKFGR
ncbi:MAG: type II toxin-antitoxin system HipA family toxin, partial [Candidatus Obscuribacterales bacterium]|nr:type II toxin-antitoxin system HipA family toxin [Candidatus Obscuribacterales bacterium]